MGNFLGNLGAAFRGQQDYQQYLDKQEEMKLRLQMNKMQLAELQDLSAQNKTQRSRQKDVDSTLMDYLAGAQVPGIAPPPQGDADVQAPAPGQQSVPMEQPAAKYGQIPLGPQMGMPPQGMPQGAPQSGMPGLPPGAGGPMTPPQRPPMPQQGPQMPPQGPPAPPPYQTVGGAARPPQGPQGIPPPPMQPGQPRPNSMTLQDAAKFIKARGITDPTTSVQILEKLTPYLNNEAKQEAAMLKMQLGQQEKQATLEEKKREADMRSKDYNLSVKERARAADESRDLKKMLGMMAIQIQQQNANTRSAVAAEKSGAGGAGGDDTAVEAAAWNSLMKNEQPPRNGGMYNKVMRYYGKIARENNMSIQELVSASADVKSRLAAKKNFEVRAQNMERAEDQVLSEIPVLEDALQALDPSTIPAVAKGGIMALRTAGDPRVTTMDQAAEGVFNEFEGIITGNPGALNVSDVANARHKYENAKTPQEMTASIKGMKRMMANAKKAVTKTRTKIMDDINNSLRNKKPVDEQMTLSNQAELSAAIKAGKLKKGDTFLDPSGNPHTVN